jgi:hypothetical protein
MTDLISSEPSAWREIDQEYFCGSIGAIQLAMTVQRERTRSYSLRYTCILKAAALPDAVKLRGFNNRNIARRHRPQLSAA